MSTMIESLVKNRLFANEEDVIKSLLADYIVRHIGKQKRDLKRFERKHSMSFERFEEYLHERSDLLEKGDLSREKRQALARAIMQEEDDWLDWKVAKEMLESWIGLREGKQY